jgi:hypothetical protein
MLSGCSSHHINPLLLISVDDTIKLDVYLTLTFALLAC